MNDIKERMIDRWFPVAAVDEACGTTAGSGLVEKAIFPWFASRPIAQARAAALTSLLPVEPNLRPTIERAIRGADPGALESLAAIVRKVYGRAPVVLDPFCGRGIISLESSRAGASSVGVDLSPVATLAGRLLADYPARNWSSEPILSFVRGARNQEPLIGDTRARLPHDVELLLAEINQRLAAHLDSSYPKNRFGNFPWGYLWVATIPCDECKRHFPLFGALGLREPARRNGDLGQSLRVSVNAEDWSTEIIDGPPDQLPTYASGTNSEGKSKKGKTARCCFCGHTHDLAAVKAKCLAGSQRDRLVAVADEDETGLRVFRAPTQAEARALSDASLGDTLVDPDAPYSAIPDEQISSGNVHTIQASGYGYWRFGDLMVSSQANQFAVTVGIIRSLYKEMQTLLGISREYAGVLTSYAAANLCRRIRRSTRGASLALSRGGVSDIFTNESKIAFSFDSFETGPGSGAGTWSSVSRSSVRAIEKLVAEYRGKPAKFINASATALPLRDQSVDVVITDPPYYHMIEYADASDIFYTWLKRVLFDIDPALFGPSSQLQDGLQNKNDEIIVRRVQDPGRGTHDKAFYERMLALSFAESRRVLRPDGHLVVIFGHSDPDAWRRLLGALDTADFVVTSAWPSRTESANTGVASIKVTITIGCRVAAPNRPVGIGSDVEREVVEAVTERVKQWDADGLAIEDQLMAAYGPAMEIYGRYSRILNPDGEDRDLDHYLSLARRAVRDAMRLRVDTIPLETFDAITRFAIFWLRTKKQTEVPKGEALFFAQADELRLDDLRGRVLVESKAGFRIELKDEKPVTSASSTFEIARAMAHSWDAGGMEAVAAVMAAAGVDPNNHHLSAVVGDLANQLPASEKMAKALAGIKRSFSTIAALIVNQRVTTAETAAQTSFFDELEN